MESLALKVLLVALVRLVLPARRGAGEGWMRHNFSH
jgi:hypothetical protein